MRASGELFEIREMAADRARRAGVEVGAVLLSLGFLTHSGKGVMKTARKRVMIVDDERIVCERLGAAVEKAGFLVETYTSGQRAIERLEVVPFDVLVTDLRMQKPDGVDLLRFARQACPELRVIVITGFPTVQIARETLQQGAVDFVTKPFRTRDLCNLIARVTREPQS